MMKMRTVTTEIVIGCRRVFYACVVNHKMTVSGVGPHCLVREGSGQQCSLLIAGHEPQKELDTKTARNGNDCDMETNKQTQ